MPVTLVDRLPLPNIKVYSAGSVLLVSVAVFHALSVTSDPNWREHALPQRQAAMAAEGSSDVLKMVHKVDAHNLHQMHNVTKNLTEQLTEMMTFMLQEPLCLWTVINMSYCVLALLGLVVQRVVFGPLRVAEAQRVKDKLWNFAFYKFIFVFGVANVQYMDEVLLWCAWFSALGSLHLLAQLCKDRFDYLSSSPHACRWAQARLLVLLASIQVLCCALLVTSVRHGLPAGRDTFAFMAAECILVLVKAMHVMARYCLQVGGADAAGPLAYYTHLSFDAVGLVVELGHVVHMVVYSNMLVSMASLVLLMQLRHLLHELQARLRRHRLYTTLATHMSRHYPMASKEEVEKNQDNCAICWEPMKEARKLPCAHLFHNSCLCQWVQQDASCPTCRRALSAAGGVGPSVNAGAPAGAGGPGAGAVPPAGDRPAAPPLRRPNHLFHFDASGSVVWLTLVGGSVIILLLLHLLNILKWNLQGSRYVSWLPSFSVEVTRVRPEPPAERLDAMLRQVQAMFPQYSARALGAELAASGSAALTVHRILEGGLRLPEVEDPIIPPEEPERPATPPLPFIDTDEEEDEEVTSEFSGEASQRECLLRRRKQMLVAVARRRYLQRQAARGAAADTVGSASVTGGPASVTGGPASVAPPGRS